MNRPEQHFRARLAVAVSGGALVAALFPFAGTALASTSVTTLASASISADTAVGATRGTTAWTSLSGPVVTEGAAADIPNSGTVTLTLGGGGWEFNTGAAVNVVPGVAAGACALTATGEVVTATTIIVTLGGTQTATSDRCKLTWTGIQVRPTSGSLPNVGALTLSGGVAGAAGTLTMTVGAPVLTFTQQPSGSALGGAVLAQQPKVKSADQFNNERVGDPVTLAVNTFPTGGTVTCTSNPVATADVSLEGIATFAGCALDKAGTYTLRATTPGQAGTIPVTTTIAISVGTAYKLVFYQQPTLGVAGVAFPAQPIVGIADAGGNIVSSGAYTVSLAITSNPSTGTLTCSTGPLNVSTQLTSAGVLASFAGCRINNAGLGYTITASSSGPASVLSSAFDVENQLVFYTQPTNAVAGATFPISPSVAVEVNSAIAVHDSTTAVTLSILPGTGATGATLSCTSGLSLPVSSGVATFSGCSINMISPASNPYRLVATTTTGLGSISSSSFAITVGPAAKLGFTSQPGNSVVAQTFPVAPVVAIQDAGGNTITTGTDSYRSVTLSIGSNPAAGTLTCTGGLTVAAVGGFATFTGCAINNAGSGYTLAATSAGLTSATSSAFLVGLTPATISLTRSRGMVTYGEPDTFSVQFGTGGAYRPFILEYTSVGVPWTTIANLTTNAAGFASVAYTPTRTGYVRARFLGTADLGAATSTVYIVGVRQTVSTLSPHHSGTKAIPGGTSITFSTTVRPTRADNAPTTVTFRIYRKVGGSWVLAYQRTALTNTSGVASYTFRWGTSAAGLWYIRAYAPRTPYNSITRYTAREYYLVQ